MNIQSKLLSRLETRKGSFISGAALAEELGCSRNAVWKAIQNLKGEGYQIVSVPNKGYQLLSENDILSPEAILPYLKRKNVSITVLPSVPSTNQKLKKLALDQMPPEGSFVLAGAQTAGRGHIGHRFFSPPDCGLYISVLLRPTAQVEIKEVLAKSAVAACRTVEALYGLSLRIRRTNDLYYAGRKIGGILTEAQTDMETGIIDFIVVGLGLNLYTPAGGYPEEIRDIAGSLEEVLRTKSPSAISGSSSTGQTPAINRSQLAAAFVNQLVQAHGDLSAVEEYEKRHDPEDPAV